MSDVIDLFVIGGGINGAGVARDAAGRGRRSLDTPRASNQVLPCDSEPARSASRIAAVAPGNLSCQASAIGAKASTLEPAPCRNTSSRRGACVECGGSSSHN